MPDRLDTRSDATDRLPPGQIVTQKWPVLHYGMVPVVDTARWRFAVSGAVERPLSITWDELLALPRQDRLRHPLRHPVEPVRQHVRGGAGERGVAAGRSTA